MSQIGIKIMMKHGHILAYSTTMEAARKLMSLWKDIERDTTQLKRTMIDEEINGLLWTIAAEEIVAIHTFPLETQQPQLAGTTNVQTGWNTPGPKRSGG